jgi:hypothetical protein
MSLFIHSENQTLLWNIISNMEITKTVFVEGSPQKSAWFKNIIEEFYIKNYSRNLTTNDLRDLNRSVVSYMVENMRSVQNRSSAYQSEAPKRTVYQEPQTVYSRNNQQASIVNKTDEYNQQFSRRQQEYESMVKKPLPPEVNFSDNIKDEPISNMEELLKQQQRQREYELNSVRPAPPQPERETIKIHIQEDIAVGADRVLEESKSKKVSWSDETDIRNDLASIKTQLAQLLTIVEELRGANKNGTDETNPL